MTKCDIAKDVAYNISLPYQYIRQVLSIKVTVNLCDTENERTGIKIEWRDVTDLIYYIC